MTVNDQRGSPDIRIPEIDKIEDIEGVKTWLRQFRHEWESVHREQWRDTNNVYKVELPAVSGGGGVIDFDIPLLTDVVFTLSGSLGIQWTAGTVSFGGTVYTIDSGNVDPATSVYIDVSSLSNPVTLGTLNGDATIVQDRWYVSVRDGSTVHAVLQSPIMHAGLLQANTITAAQIVAGTITATELSASYLIIGANHTGTTSGDNTGNHTGTVAGTTATTVTSGAALGATANQDSTASILAGNLTGTVSTVTIIDSGKIATGLVIANSIVAGTITAAELSAAYLVVGNNHTGTTSGTNTGNHTGTLAGTTATTVTSGAASGATANQDSTATILSGNHTGQVSSVTIIDGGKINTGLVIADSMAVTTLSAITANIGTLTTGTIGSGTDFFNVTDSVIELKDSSSGEYLYMSDGLISINSAAGGGGNTFIELAYNSGAGNAYMTCDRHGAGSSGVIYHDGGVLKGSAVVTSTGCVLSTFTLNLCTVPTSNVVASSATKGQMMYTNTSGIMLTLSISTDGKILTTSGGNPVWAEPASSFTISGTFTGAGSDVTISPSGASAMVSYKIKHSGTQVARHGVRSGSMVSWKEGDNASTNTSDVTISGGSLTFKNGRSGVNLSGSTYYYEITYTR